MSEEFGGEVSNINLDEIKCGCEQNKTAHEFIIPVLENQFSFVRNGEIQQLDFEELDRFELIDNENQQSKVVRFLDNQRKKIINIWRPKSQQND